MLYKKKCGSHILHMKCNKYSSHNFNKITIYFANHKNIKCMSHLVFLVLPTKKKETIYKSKIKIWWIMTYCDIGDFITVLLTPFSKTKYTMNDYGYSDFTMAKGILGNPHQALHKVNFYLKNPKVSVWSIESFCCVKIPFLCNVFFQKVMLFTWAFQMSTVEKESWSV